MYYLPVAVWACSDDNAMKHPKPQNFLIIFQFVTNMRTVLVRVMWI